MGERHVTWEGFYNARDLGGLSNRAGRALRYGQLIRSADLRFVTALGWHAAHDAGVRTVVDLRNDREARGTADAVDAARHAEICRVHVPLDGIEDVELWRFLRSQEIHGTPLYYRPFLERKAERVVAVLTAIAQAETGAVIFHCSAGRDRTGLVSLLLLALADVDIETIADDYELTTEPLRSLFQRMGMGDGDLDQVAGLMARKNMTARDALRQTVENLDVEAYLLGAGMSPADLVRLRARLLDDGAKVEGVEAIR
ncbi:tyrosine-protein phosphatase [Pendulispora rubella]|uniref:Tyrosine-protein phosphatase n=1 Tax=Pendulispora rubella TaxID=2741070 RepID=A0ABZ2L5Q1_9BACT